jgi:hypothetical protein
MQFRLTTSPGEVRRTHVGPTIKADRPAQQKPLHVPTTRRGLCFTPSRSSSTFTARKEQTNFFRTFFPLEPAEFSPWLRGAGAAMAESNPPSAANTLKKREKMTVHPMGHRFCKKTFRKPMHCHHCAELMWGLTSQGLQCEGQRLTDVCSAKRGRDKGGAS